MNTVCQSCGMPLSKDPKNGGSNADGSKSTEYCSYCYEKGVFVTPNFTARQMQAFCVEKMQEQGVIKPLAWLLTRGIPRLKRWKQT
jgi:hypothetical protein